jgi:hypothetical protein
MIVLPSGSEHSIYCLIGIPRIVNIFFGGVENEGGLSYTVTLKT